MKSIVSFLNSVQLTAASDHQYFLMYITSWSVFHVQFRKTWCTYTRNRTNWRYVIFSFFSNTYILRCIIHIYIYKKVNTFFVFKYSSVHSGYRRHARNESNMMSVDKQFLLLIFTYKTMDNNGNFIVLIGMCDLKMHSIKLVWIMHDFWHKQSSIIIVRFGMGHTITDDNDQKCGNV